MNFSHIENSTLLLSFSFPIPKGWEKERRHTTIQEHLNFRLPLGSGLNENSTPNLLNSRLPLGSGQNENSTPLLSFSFPIPKGWEKERRHTTIQEHLNFRLPLGPGQNENVNPYNNWAKRKFKSLSQLNKTKTQLSYFLFPFPSLKGGKKKDDTLLFKGTYIFGSL